MALSAFEMDRGLAQGRLEDAQAPSGAHILELGHAGRALEYLELGDYVEYTQSFDKRPTSQLVRLTLRLKAPSVVTAGAVWKFQAIYDGTVYYERAIEADGRELTLTDIAVSLVTAPQPAQINFRLALVAA